MLPNLQKNKELYLSLLLACMVGLSHLASEPRQSPPESARHPLKGRIYVSGSFGEYRKFSRYHMGLDYKTFNRNGLPVYAPYAGFIESLHISQLGYGNAIFLRTPDGKRLTFAHLHDFDCSLQVEGSLRELELFRRSVKILSQNRNLHFSIPRWFRYRAGECLARTGESGSGPPHLHYEILKNGVFIDPLSLRGYKIKDHTAPIMLELLLESKRGLVRIPLKKIESRVSGKSDHYKPTVKIPAYAHNEMVRIMISGYDTMAARNRNGIEFLNLKLGARDVHHTSLSRISMAHFAHSSRFYHTAYTDIGKFYVFILHPAGSGGYRAGKYAKKSKLSAEAILGDASGNQSILNFEIPLVRQVSALPAHTSDQAAILSELPLQIIYSNSRSILIASSGVATMQIIYGPGSVQLNGRARLLALSKLPVEAKERLQLNVGGTDIPVQELAGPVFYLDGQELYYRYGGKGTAIMPDSGDGIGLYYYSYAKKRWRLLASPVRREAGKVHYKFPVKIIGPIAQLKDLSAPRMVANLLWQPPSLHAENKQLLVREYALSDRGSGLDLRHSQILLDGEAIAYRWVRDRSVIRLELPISLIPNRGVLVSMQFKDQAGNASPWYFEYLERPE